MNFIKNLTVKVKLWALVGVLLTITFIIYMNGLSFIKEVEHEVHHLDKEQIPELIAFSHVEKYLLAAGAATADAMVEHDTKALHHAKEDAEKLTEEFAKLKKLFAHDAEELERLDKLYDEIKHVYNEGIELAIAHIDESKQNHELNEKLERYNHIVSQVEDELEAEVHHIIEGVDKETKMLVNDAESEKFSFGILFTIGLLTGVGVGYFLTRNISNALESFKSGLEGFFAYVNKEADDTALLDDSSNDEFGKMATEVNHNITKSKQGIQEDREFIADAIKVMGQFEKGDLSQRLTKSVNNQLFCDLKKVVNTMADNLEANIDNILKVLNQYSHYDYCDTIDEQGLQSHLLKLSQGVNELGKAITTMLIENKSNGLTLSDSSAALLTNVNRLNESSNEAAASLEETSAALEEITANISANTDNIVKMSQFANSVTASANNGSKLAQETTKAMEEIDEQVQSINEAISVIDQIAFQTNILSLNAAVEAATAGEAGKGFAVVAQEVRNLANRSAEAAKQIKDIVETATHKADEGKSIAQNMITGYTELNNSITQTIELIGDIKNASTEQSEGIQQINDAVSVLDQKTQQNAAISNETHSVATVTDKISQSVIESVDSKEFVGKNDVKAIKHEQTTTPAPQSAQKPKSVEPKKSEPKPKEVKATQTNENWESF